MAGNVIREFLVALGFKIDEASFKKFGAGIDGATAKAVNLGKQATGAALAVTAAVSKIAEQYEELYFASLRTGNSISILRQHQEGAKAIGITAESSAASLEHLNLQLKFDPGKAALLNFMGIQTVGRDTKTIYDDLIKTLKAYYAQGPLGAALARSYAAQFGITEADLLRRIQLFGQSAEAEANYRERLRQSGLSLEDLGAKSLAFERANQKLYQSIGLIADQTANKWLPSMTSTIEFLTKISDGLLRVGKDTDGWSSTILSVVAALGALKAAALLLPAGLAARLGISAAAGVGGTLALPLVAAGTLGAVAYGASKTPEGQAYRATGDIRTDARNWADAVKPTLQRWFGLADSNDPAPVEKKDPFTGKPLPKAGSGLGNTKGMDPDFVARLERMRADMPTELGGFGMTDGFRSFQQQADVYARKPHLAARPGTSNHEKGMAADLWFKTPAGRAWIHQNAPNYGLRFPMGHEPWHIEPDRRLNGAGAMAPGAGQQPGGGGNNVTATVTINGATDPEATARAVKRELDPYVTWNSVARNAEPTVR